MIIPVLFLAAKTREIIVRAFYFLGSFNFDSSNIPYNMREFPIDFLKSDQDWPEMSKENVLMKQNENLTEIEVFTAQCCLKKIFPSIETVKCQQLNSYETTEKILHILTLCCPICGKTVAVWIGQWWSIETILQSNDKTRNNFCQVTTLGEYLVLWCLNSIVFGEYENDNNNLEYLPIFRDEFSRIYWQNGVAVAFYTVKSSGMTYSAYQLDSYCMPVIDLIFVKKSHRRSGIGLTILLDAIKIFPNQNIGLSSPISDSMYKVLHKFLKKYPESRPHFWETQWTACEGFRKNVWFTIAKIFKATRSI